MIAALKQYGANYAKRTVKRQMIRYGVALVLALAVGAYEFLTGRTVGNEPAEQAAVAASATASVPKPAPAPAATPAAAPATPAAAAPITTNGIDLNAPKRAAQAAVAAENAQLAAQTDAAALREAPISGPGSTPSGVIPAPAGALPAPAVDAAAAGTGVTREVYGYTGASRRDPFYSLILTDDLRPLLSDLRLVGILYESSGRRAVAIMRDLQTNAQYRVATGQALGRMRVTQIRPRAVMFSIEEFGLSRQDSLVWTDSTKVRN
jgi:hypothetical protein